MCLPGRPCVVVRLQISQFRQIREEIHKLEEEVQNFIAVLIKDNVKVEVFIDKVDHIG